MNVHSHFVYHAGRVKGNSPRGRRIPGSNMQFQRSAVTTAVGLAHPDSPVAWAPLAGVRASHSALPAVAWATDEARAEALWQSALVASTEHDAPRRAAQLLHRLVQQLPHSSRAPEASAHRAAILDRLGDPGAAAAWQEAAELAPDHPRAGRWWLTAADRYSERGMILTAVETYEEATRYPSEAAVAWVAIGRLTLAHDPGAAHAAFDRAAASAQRPSTLRLARLGRATALERLEGPEAALAEVDDTIAEEGSDPSLERRRDRLMNGG